MIKAVCFDMFWTLVDPHSELEHFEYEPLGVSREMWGLANWTKKTGKQRGNGKLGTPEAIMDRVFANLPVKVTEEARNKAVEGKKLRMRTALTQIDKEILECLETLKKSGFKIGLISNADAFDDMFWDESPLKQYFDDVIFSYRVRLLKPDRRIYKLSLKNLGVMAKEAVFVGDGGSDEHHGAKKVGMTTVWTEYLHTWDEKTRAEIGKYADLRIENFKELTEYLIG